MKKLQATWYARAGAALAILAAMAITSFAQTFTTLVNFGTNGSNPSSGLIQGPDGNLYGTTAGAGANDWGTVFKMTPTGTLTTLYSFCAQTNCTDGNYPSGLVLATDGNFYGETGGGAAYFTNYNVCNGNGCGTVFKITPEGTLMTLYSFCAQVNCDDGSNPYAGLIQGVDGNLYGTTLLGGASAACNTLGANGCGTVFKITRAGTLTTLHSFALTDGAAPSAGLVQATNGNLYGTTYEGGNTGGPCEIYGCGTVFKITPGGILTTLYSFCPEGECPDGADPDAGLVQATDGNLYGTTYEGGASTACSGGCGTVFKITPKGILTRLHSFALTDGDGPEAVLVQATDGDLYGTTFVGGTSTACGNPYYGCGTAFKITLSGTLTTLYNFCSQSNCTDGYYLYTGVFQGTDGNLYGTTSGGGAYEDGTVFSLSVGLGPFVEMLPTLGPVGAPVRILGTNLTGTTSVTFNGTAATFTVNSTGTAINTTVPSGATTGTVQVVTPSGTLSSNVPFRVRH